MELISILIAAYKPNIYYFEKQLNSLNSQTYSNLEIIIRDDSADETAHQEICAAANRIITNFPFILHKNEQNLGSNKTFEALTQDAHGKYLAYCDQDDLWAENKIEILVKELKASNSLLVYSTLSLIDENDKIIAEKINHVRKRLIHVEGDMQWRHLLRRNSVTGCAMMIDAKIAKDSLPFPSQDTYIHDQWLTIYASIQGRLRFIDIPLVYYRIHTSNQVGVAKMPGIEGKEDYIKYRIKMEEDRLNFLTTRLTEYPEVFNLALRLKNKLSQRKAFLSKPTFLKFIYLCQWAFDDVGLFLFEVTLGILSENKSQKLLKLLKRTKL